MAIRYRAKEAIACLVLLLATGCHKQPPRPQLTVSWFFNGPTYLATATNTGSIPVRGFRIFVDVPTVSQVGGFPSEGPVKRNYASFDSPSRGAKPPEDVYDLLPGQKVSFYVYSGGVATFPPNAGAADRDGQSIELIHRIAETP